ncbi:hypothetical protein QO002_001114 [Pararhizobium capsulatum DSM 1112]|uniref:Uncharacterized protein n=1 Tax=Pararhizobium capsulatum DSM 1112 TaxID=1121113 RepID=A0ABU0BL42_9HYPH|nr:hypothetical protein [Pararhizobium capsulatum]MDQ0318976.1 hypothetical protein [Pararhizobium capsulatum DSM 1112]
MPRPNAMPPRPTGLSKDQQVQAVRAASVPADIRDESLIERDSPPTTTALADMGRKPQLARLA